MKIRGSIPDYGYEVQANENRITVVGIFHKGEQVCAIEVPFCKVNRVYIRKELKRALGSEHEDAIKPLIKALLREIFRVKMLYWVEQALKRAWGFRSILRILCRHRRNNFALLKGADK